jgi:hypothetical protein
MERYAVTPERSMHDSLVRQPGLTIWPPFARPSALSGLIEPELLVLMGVRAKNAFESARG